MGPRTLTVLDAGLRTTVQDLGRPGFAHLGVPRSGALDGVSAAAANRLVGNDPAAAVLETTAGGCTVQVSRAVTVAITGAPCAVEIGGRKLGGRDVGGRAGPHGLAVTVAAGTRIRLGPAGPGVHSYLGLAGGIAVAPVLGSRATDLLGGLGPPALRRGDVLALGPPGGPPVGSDVPVLARLPGADGVTVAISSGPRRDWFADAAWDALIGRPWTVSARTDRTALGLDGPELGRRFGELPGGGELPSEGLVLGAVQVPTAGTPLVFLADHPVTGGYPVIAVVAPVDLPLLAQCPPGTIVRFTDRGTPAVGLGRRS